MADQEYEEEEGASRRMPAPPRPATKRKSRPRPGAPRPPRLVRPASEVATEPRRRKTRRKSDDFERELKQLLKLRRLIAK